MLLIIIIALIFLIALTTVIDCHNIKEPYGAITQLITSRPYYVHGFDGYPYDYYYNPALSYPYNYLFPYTFPYY